MLLQAAPAAQQPPSMHPVQLSAAEARTLLHPGPSSAQSTSPSRLGRTGASAPAGPLQHSRLHQGDGVLLHSVDLAVIADSSTGGAGIPRPYGKFVAPRGGDGRAMWSRLPPERGTWRAKALPV